MYSRILQLFPRISKLLSVLCKQFLQYPFFVIFPLSFFLLFLLLMLFPSPHFLFPSSPPLPLFHSFLFLFLSLSSVLPPPTPLSSRMFFIVLSLFSSHFFFSRVRREWKMNVKRNWKGVNLTYEIVILINLFHWLCGIRAEHGWRHNLGTMHVI